LATRNVLLRDPAGEFVLEILAGVADCRIETIAVILG
jgi:hypothetical protein